MFRARLPSIFITSHNMLPLPLNLHLVTTSRGPDNAIRKSTQHDTSEALLLPRKMANATHLLKTTQEYCPCHTKRLWTRYEKCWNDTKCHACHTKRGYATFETSKSDHSCKTRHRHGHTVLTRPPADGCERCGRDRKRNVERAHPQPPRPPEWNGNPCYAFEKKQRVNACLFALPHNCLFQQNHHIWYRPYFFYCSQVHWVLSLGGKIWSRLESAEIW